jgi:hypothetical protein
MQRMTEKLGGMIEKREKERRKSKEGALFRKKSEFEYKNMRQGNNQALPGESKSFSATV